MRKRLVQTVTDLLEKDDRVVLLLGDIGVFAFREAFDQFPKRVYNIGILEQASISLAAGLALEGMIPIFHTIAPFMVERAFEQLKIDFGYQGLGGSFISVGASYDYASLGCTHHCPGDIALLKTIPGMQTIVPGHPEEFDLALRRNYNSKLPTYYRLSESHNLSPCFHNVVKTGNQGVVVLAVGPMLDRVCEACKDFNVTIRYTTLEYFPALPAYFDKIIVVEPFYEGTLTHLFPGRQVFSIGVPRKFLTNYGTTAEHDEACGLTVEHIREKIGEIL